MLRQLGWEHLKDIHAAIKFCDQALVTVVRDPRHRYLEAPARKHYGKPEAVNVTVTRRTRKRASFLSNINSQSSAAVHSDGNITRRSRSVVLCKEHVLSVVSISFRDSVLWDYVQRKAPAVRMDVWAGTLVIVTTGWANPLAVACTFCNTSLTDGNKRVAFELLRSKKDIFSYKHTVLSPF